MAEVILFHHAQGLTPGHTRADSRHGRRPIPGDQRHFADSSLPSYDAEAADLLTQRVLDFLAAQIGPMTKEKQMQQQSQSTLDVIYESWRGYQEKLRAAVAPLTADQLALQPAPHMWPLGQILQHIVSVRAGWFSGTLQDEDDGMNEFMAWGRRDSPARSGAELARGLDETWAFIEARLQRWTPDDCAQTFPDEWDGQVFELSRSWVIYHVMEHDLHHGGEVSLILGMNALPSLDL